MTLRLIFRNIVPNTPAAVKNSPPRPGKRSTLCTIDPTGKAPSGKASPSLAISIKISKK